MSLSTCCARRSPMSIWLVTESAGELLLELLASYDMTHRVVLEP